MVRFLDPVEALPPPPLSDLSSPHAATPTANAGTSNHMAVAPLKLKTDPSSVGLNTERGPIVHVNERRLCGLVAGVQPHDHVPSRRAAARRESAAHLEQLVEHEPRVAQTVSGVSRQAGVPEAV